MIVGEAPGIEEDMLGIPFVGKAGKRLDKALNRISIDEEKEAYVCNIVKCRPPANRNPKPEEIEACMPYLKEQIAYMKPKKIITLGRVPASALLYSPMKGTMKAWMDKNPYMYRQKGLKPIPLYIHYHPSYIDRNQSKHDEWVEGLRKTIEKGKV